MSTPITIKRNSPEVPVKWQTEVLVVGAGPAGFAAAVTAARRGAKTMLVERGGVFGGMWTMGLLSPYFDNQDKPGLNRELRELLGKRKAWGGLWNISFDQCEMTMALDEIAIAAGVKPLFYAIAEEPIVIDNQVKGVIVAAKGGPAAIMADVVIDASGDGDIAAGAGVPFDFGRPQDGLTQPMTMMFKIGGVREEYPRDDIIGWYNLLTARVGAEKLLNAIPYDYPAIIKLPRPGEALLQWTHVKRLSAIDPDELTAATLDGRRQVRDAMSFLPAIRDLLGDVYLLDLPSVIGVRETRRIKGEYCISDDDVKHGSQFADGICDVYFGVDIHEPEEQKQTVFIHKNFQIPYRSLVPQGVDNLLTAGRCISGSFVAHAAYRVTGDCVAMGEAAGIAAVMAVQRKVTPRSLAGEEVAAEMKKLL